MALSGRGLLAKHVDHAVVCGGTVVADPSTDVPASMTLTTAITIVACIGLLALALLAVSKGRRNPFALPLSLFCIDLFAWNLAQMAYHLSGDPLWRWLDVTVSPLTSALGLHFALVFVGRLRQLRWLLAAVYAGFGTLCVVSAVAPLLPDIASFPGSDAWAVLHLAGVALALPILVWLLVRHYRDSEGHEERARTRLIFVALALGATLGSTELLADLGIITLRLGPVGTFMAAALLSAAAYRFRLFDYELDSGVVSYALGVGLVGAVAYLAVFYLLSSDTAVLVSATMTVTLVVVLATRLVAKSVAERRARTEHLAHMGRLSEQLAHDVRNPLAALRGAVQFLQEEIRAERSLDDQREFFELMVDQIDRIDGVLSQYHRHGTVDSQVRSLDLNGLVSDVLRLQPFAAGDGVTIETELAEELPRCLGDSELLATALENLVRNAIEALDGDGTITVSTELLADGQHVALHVRDDGPGMDPRTREQAFDDFFTTKGSGSGLGLAYVRRVAEEQGGTAHIDSALGRGTVVTLEIPTSA
jgi:signal transduction histidine kinase